MAFGCFLDCGGVATEQSLFSSSMRFKPTACPHLFLPFFILNYVLVDKEIFHLLLCCAAPLSSPHRDTFRPDGSNNGSNNSYLFEICEYPRIRAPCVIVILPPCQLIFPTWKSVGSGKSGKRTLMQSEFRHTWCSFLLNSLGNMMSRWPTWQC